MSKYDSAKKYLEDGCGSVCHGLEKHVSEACMLMVQLRRQMRWLESPDHKEFYDVTLHEVNDLVTRIEDTLAFAAFNSESSRVILTERVGFLDQVIAEERAAAAASMVHPINNPDVRAQVWRLTGGKCAYCDCALEQDSTAGQSFAVEHVVPRSCGGPDNLANYVPSCKSCNSSKCDTHVLTFIKRRTEFGYARPDLRLVSDATSGG
jgi:hypothetical protein